MHQTPPNGFKTFFTVLSGQMASSFGSGLTQFALVLSALEMTGSMTQYSLTFLCMYLPAFLFSPWAGTIVDRKDRKQILYWSNGVAFMATLGLILNLQWDTLSLWQIYLVILVKAIASTFQLTLTQTLVTVLVPQEHHGRANGLTQMADALPRIFAPLVGASLLAWIHIKGIILIELATYLLAFWTLSRVRLPQEDKGEESHPSVLKEAWEGWRYIAGRQGLVALLIYSTFNNFLIGIIEVLVNPLVRDIMNYKDYQEQIGLVLMFGGLGMLAGSILMVAWGGPKRKINGVLAFTMLGGVLLIPGGLIHSIKWFYIGAFLYFVTIPISLGANQTIWQGKVPLPLQGRVFSLRRMTMLSSVPIAALVAGPLADAFTPLLVKGGAWASTVGLITGVGPGRGTAFVFMLMGILSVLFALMGYGIKPIRRVESELPDVSTTCDDKVRPSMN
ncbi:MFS transporter [Laceyella putida]|uniref:MFS transporter n=1 Tax=Laceyella putida TaxID=110101 RepID=A0ABW2RHP7_9BACL